MYFDDGKFGGVITSLEYSPFCLLSATAGLPGACFGAAAATAPSSIDDDTATVAAAQGAGVVPDAFAVSLTDVVKGTSKLGSEKGINLPDTALAIRALVPEDREILENVLSLGPDLIGLSFVQSPEDVLALHAALDAAPGGAGSDIGIILKVETEEAFRRLPELLLAAMRRGGGFAVMARVPVFHSCAASWPSGRVLDVSTPPLFAADLAAVSSVPQVARGDLGVEVGFARLSELQEEILWLCEAAHTPVIWATQVMETFARSGVPTRAEVTDAAMGGRAECVMLNKGPFIPQVVTFIRVRWEFSAAASSVICCGRL